ncbi:MAG: ParB/RepB/Spo0J family partition protein [Chloroflexota bacterium]
MISIASEKQFSIGNIFNNIASAFFTPKSKLHFFYDVIGSKEISYSNCIGSQTVELSQIVGSTNESRCQDFDASFKLVREFSKSRLEGVEKAWRTKKLPPISLVEFDGKYFVQDGHHRVAIAKNNGQEKIKAIVTVVCLIESSATLNLTPATI